MLILGLCIFTLVYFGFAKAGSAVLIWPLFAVYGLFMALTEGTSKAFVADLAREEVRATSLGVFYTVTGILSLLASTIAGILWTRIGPHATFLYGSVMALLSLVLFGLLF